MVNSKNAVSMFLYGKSVSHSHLDFLGGLAEENVPNCSKSIVAGVEIGKSKDE